MEIIYISSACNPSNIEDINKTAKTKLEISGIKFHNLLIKGLATNGAEIKSIIGLPISNKINSKKIWKKRKEKNDNIEYRQVGFINIPILKQLTTIINIVREYKKIIKTAKDVYTIIDATYVTVLPFIVAISNKNKIKTIGIVADIYDYMCDVDNNNGKNRLLSNAVKKVIQRSYLKLNGYILLTEKMNEVINLNKMPYVVIEGCCDSNMINAEKKLKTGKKILLYSGKLAEKFGIKLLIEAFKIINEPDIELWIYGDGEEKQYVIEESRNNNDIKYKGMVSNEEVVKAQQEATLLINPRPTKEQFTKYSFPSKNIEYMASGTPMITTNLPGMPEEYKEHVYLLNDETVEGFANSLSFILKKSPEELYKKRKRSKGFYYQK